MRRYHKNGYFKVGLPSVSRKMTDSDSPEDTVICSGYVIKNNLKPL